LITPLTLNSDFEFPKTEYVIVILCCSDDFIMNVIDCYAMLCDMTCIVNMFTLHIFTMSYSARTILVQAYLYRTNIKKTCINPKNKTKLN